MTTGRVAVGIARAQAGHRRVAVGDLFAESPPIQELVHTDDPHGIVDSFLYGVSLTKIAHEVPDAGQLFVMPSGTEPPTTRRFCRIRAGIASRRASAKSARCSCSRRPASAPHIEKLVAATDGAVLVGDAVAPQIPAARVIGVGARAATREPPSPHRSACRRTSAPRLIAPSDRRASPASG